MPHAGNVEGFLHCILVRTTKRCDQPQHDYWPSAAMPFAYTALELTVEDPALSVGEGRTVARIARHLAFPFAEVTAMPDLTMLELDLAMHLIRGNVV